MQTCSIKKRGQPPTHLKLLECVGKRCFHDTLLPSEGSHEIFLSSSVSLFGLPQARQLKQRTFTFSLFWRLEDQDQGRCQQIPPLVRPLFLPGRWLPSPCVLTQWRDREVNKGREGEIKGERASPAPSSSSSETLISTCGSPTSWPHLNLTMPQRPHLQILSYLGLALQCLYFGETPTFSP